MEQVAIVDYGSGNLHSAHKALVRAAQDVTSEINVVVTDDPAELLKSDRIVLPGVGAFGACKAALEARAGVVETLSEVALEKERPFLGICVGMQLLASRGVEHGQTEGLGWIGGTVRPLEAPGLKIPHMGWNTVNGADHVLLPPDGDAYFVHSYCFDAEFAGHVAATAQYGETFTAMVARGNIAGVQFHPEKSQVFGLQLLANFLTWDPA